MEETKITIDIANEHIGWMIRDEALELGYDAFFRSHVYEWRKPENYDTPREFAKAAAHSIPDYCSFDAFFAKFEDRFAAWYETGDIDGIADDPAEE